MNNMNNTNIPGGAPMSNENGRWVPVDPNSVGFAVDPNIPVGAQFQGADGASYCVGTSQQQYQSIMSNMNNAVPTPSQIVQMPPIVQPIALVPYTTQNQPMLQYDPYSRPVDPQVAPKAPNYVKKPYKGISLACMLIALIGGILLAVLSVACFKANSMREAFNVSGIDFIISLLMIFGLKEIGGQALKSNYFNTKVAPFQANGQWGTEDMLSTIVTAAIPVCVLLVLIFSVVLFIKYATKLGKKETPRCFSVLALLNIILCVATIGLLIGMSDAEVVIANGARLENVGAFFALDSTIFWGAGLIIALVASIALLILPLCAKKNAYMLEKSNDANTYILDK